MMNVGRLLVCFSLACTYASASEWEESPPIELENEAVNEAQANIFDMLPPDASLQEAKELLAQKTQLQSFTPEDATKPLRISDYYAPFNSKRLEWMAWMQQQPKDVLLGGERVALLSPHLVHTFYASQDYPTIWTNESHFLPLLDSLKKVLQNSRLDGLYPDFYHWERIEPLRINTDYDDIFAYELLLSDAYLTLAAHLYNGKTDPHASHETWNAMPADDEHIAAVLVQAVIKQDLQSALDEINASDRRYTALKHYFYQLLKTSNPYAQSKSLPDITLRQGMRHPAVRILRAKLGLPFEQAGADVFDAPLTEEVRRFQNDLGLQADGVVGKESRRLLNASTQSMLDWIAINMERLRWMPNVLGDSYILVNIPSFYVSLYANDRAIFHSRIVVGTKKRQTPVFMEQLRHIVLNPYWNVPTTIFTQDHLPRLRKDPYALSKSIKVISPSGKIVDSATVDWQSPSARQYRLRQDPGPYNSLGSVKFLFPNPHAIYMHDTPKRNLFKRSNRMHSSGCIRVEHPLQLAELLLQGSEWTMPAIQSYVHDQKKERWINPPHTPIVYISYWTIWANDDGKIKVSADIYDLDAPLLQRLRAKASPLE